MSFAALSFLNPWILLALATLPAIWWLLRTTPPPARRVRFPAIRLLRGLISRERTPARSPWWLTLIRMLAAALLILALAEPVIDRDQAELTGGGPVVLLVDNGWASASRWQARKDMVGLMISEAERQHRPVVVVPTAPEATRRSLGIDTPKAARDRAEAMLPAPYAPDRMAALAQVERTLGGAGSLGSGVSLVWISDGLSYGEGAALDAALGRAGGGPFTIVDPAAGDMPLGLSSRIVSAGKLEARIVRPSGGAFSGSVLAMSGRGQQLAEADFKLAAGETAASVEIELPLELRNQIASLRIAGERSAGAVHLLDAGSRWNRIGLVSGASREKSQPLLSPLFYIERALAPYTDLVRAEEGDTAAAVEGLIGQNVSVLVLADIGKLAGSSLERVERWVDKGGVLVRFAGPRLEQGDDALLPVALRLGGRALGGALSWSEPQALAPFEEGSIFSGLQVPADVRVSRQVLADPALLTDRTQIWARLADGTPLVTAEHRKEGWIVLFHVTANSDWSNLPISGLFVEMLQRVIRLTGLADLAKASGDETSEAADLAVRNPVLAPTTTLDGFGDQVPPPAAAQPLPPDAPADLAPGPVHPPGLYGPSGSARAVNVVTAGTTLTPLVVAAPGARHGAYRAEDAITLKPSMLVAAFALLLVDVLAVLLLQLAGTGWRRRTAALALVGLGLAAGAPPLSPRVALAQDGTAAAPAPGAVDEEFALKAALQSRLAYVVTGDAEADETSRLGLIGLGRILTDRTAYEPAEPMGVDPERDELSFFPVLYWPVLSTAPALSEAALNRVDAFMKEGGMIVFDTRDGLDAMPSLDGTPSPTAEALQRLIGNLDIPRLESAPPDHVLTKSFYLLKSFPGRWDVSPLWVEAQSGDGEADAMRPRQTDGVSAILITANDLAGAWAADDAGRPLYAAVPGGEEQREYAYRTGVNIVMYALTGSYKADQVHIPALLERLGQ